MDVKLYTLVNKFKCCGNVMLTVIIKEKAACAMPERNYCRIIGAERKFKKKINIEQHK